ncbi:RecQ mediated genome instability 2 [Homo sapiens]|uniref:RecQ mediated genome instability 2 n=1 Tax=Homo sapiens TaxID=9606 RepID=A0A3B3ISX4_HUMAN|nr:RecQ mediated genome instability 2 [Homo sapiens]KAI4053575.1 RecQ mediated genome instability 2 [Homo sapiens]
MAAAADSFSGGPAGVRLPRSPPLKVLAEQLRRDAEGGPGAWRLSRAAAGRGPLDLAAVWMQGRVVMADRGEARLRDPSGDFSVRGLERVPRGRPCLVPDMLSLPWGLHETS